MSKKGTAYIIGDNPAMHELLQPFLYKAGYVFKTSATWHFIKSNQFIYTREIDKTLGYGSIESFIKHGFERDYEIVNLTGWTLWNHPDDKQPEADYIARNGLFVNCKLGVAKPWLDCDKTPSLDLMNIGRKPKISDLERANIKKELSAMEVKMKSLKERLGE